MALIKCGECEKEVSNKAAACPGCGAPFESEAIGSGVKRLTTTQRTSKSIKLQSLLAGIMTIVGVYLMVADSANDEPANGIAPLIFLIGFIWFIVNRIKKWWHHD